MKHGCLGAFLVFLFVIIFSSFLMLLNVKTHFFNAKFYRSVINNPTVHTKLINALADSFSDFSPAVTNQALTKDIARIALANTITVSWVDKNINPSIDNIFSFITGKTDEITGKIPLSSLQTEFNNNFIKAVVDNYDRLPVCTTAQKTNSENLCHPSGMSKSQYAAQLEKQNIFAQEPMKDINLSDQIEKNQNTRIGLENARTSYKIIAILVWILLALSIILFGSIILLARHSVSSVLRWTGWSLVIPSIIVGIMSLVPSLLLLLFSSIRNDFSQLILGQVVGAAGASLRLTAILIFLIGLVEIILSYFLGRQKTYQIKKA